MGVPRMTLFYAWLAFNAGILVGAWWASRRPCR